MAPHLNLDNSPRLSREGNVYLLRLGGRQNRITTDWIATVEAHLSEVERSPVPRALVTSASGNCWSTGIDLDWIANDVAMQVGAAPQYTLMEVAENLERMDQALFEGFVTRDPLGFFIVGPPDALEHHGHFGEHSLDGNCDPFKHALRFHVSVSHQVSQIPR